MSGFDAAVARVQAIQQHAKQVATTVPGESFDSVLARQAQNGPVAGAASLQGGSLTAAVRPMNTDERITLGQMLAPVTPVVVPPPTNAPVGGVYTSEQLNAYLQTHDVKQRNGRLEGHELAATPGGWHGDVQLLPPAADAWRLMRAAAAKDGIDLRAIDSYRDWHTQNHAHQEYLAGNKPANVLPPGSSEHGNGLAVDVTNGAIIGRDDREWVWLSQNARDFGWYPISNETWHWEFRGTGA